LPKRIEPNASFKNSEDYKYINFLLKITQSFSLHKRQRAFRLTIRRTKVTKNAVLAVWVFGFADISAV